MPSLRTIVLATAASAVTLVNADYVIDPESVPLSLRKVWCQNEIETCPMICGQTSKGDTKVNECNPKTLTYGCICGDGKQPNVSEYSLTLPFYVCQEWGNQCVTDCAGSASCASDCRENNPCGAEDPKKYNTTSTATGTGAVKATASATDDAEASETIAFLFGDLGTHVPYNTYFRTPQESLSTVKWILRDLQALGDKPAVISHIGDISYAKGYAWLWDHFFEQIEPIAASTPYHVCIGNHEYDWPSQPWKPTWAADTYNGKDGGGECGVPYSIKFRMPGNSSLPTGTVAPDTRNLYYSLDAGVVHFVYMSTETDFTHGSDQYSYIKADLERVNRSRTPFVVFQGHRPMYTSSNETKDAAHREQMIRHLEPLFVEHGVTLALWGHIHRYERFCPMKNYRCLNTSSSFVYPGAPAHVVIGMAGQDFQPSWEPRPDHPDVPIFPQPQRSMYRGGEFGYAKLVATREKLTLMYIGNHDGQVHDMVEILSPQVGADDGSPGKLVGALPGKMRYLGIAGGVVLALLLGFMAGFAVRRKKKAESAGWSPVQDEES